MVDNPFEVFESREDATRYMIGTIPMWSQFLFGINIDDGAANVLLESLSPFSFKVAGFRNADWPAA